MMLMSFLPPAVTRYGYGKHIQTVVEEETLNMFLKVWALVGWLLETAAIC